MRLWSIYLSQLMGCLEFNIIVTIVPHEQPFTLMEVSWSLGSVT